MGAPQRCAHKLGAPLRCPQLLETIDRGGELNG